MVCGEFFDRTCLFRAIGYSQRLGRYMDADGGPEAASLMDRAPGGDVAAWGALLAQHQDRLARMLVFRLDPRLRGRVDAGDVVQEAFIVATARRADFFAQSTQSLFLWLRWIFGNTLLELHRHH